MNFPTTPDKLYGRERERQQLIGLFNRICFGEGILLSVPGHSGIGKSSLVNVLKDPVQSGNGVFISGKFEQYQQNIPYFAIQQSLARFSQYIGSVDKVTQNNLVKRIRTELGNQGKVLTDFIPEFEQLLGKQPEMGDISPQEARHRFFNVMKNFFKAISMPEHPVVLFIDDWQWADLASLELIKNLGIGTDLRYFMLVTSFRDNEVSKESLLLSTINELKKGECPVEVLHVDPISVENIIELIKDSFLPDINRPGKLSELVYSKTKGNPYFVKSLLEYLVEAEYVYYREKDQSWNWKIDGDADDEIPSDIVELFREKLKRYDENALNLISLASCLGNSFSISNLAIISDWNPAELAKIMDLFIEGGIIRSPEGDAYEFPGSTRKIKHLIFIHDRLQQAANSFISKDELSSILLKIGRLLLKNLSPEKLEQQLFEVVSKLNAGYELITDRQELLGLVSLNIRAAEKAFASTAYSASLIFFHATGNIISNNSLDEYLWENEYEMYLNYFIELSESEFLEGNYGLAEKYLDTAILKARTLIEKADIYNNLIVQLTLQARYPEAIGKGREILSLLGISLPDKEYETARDKEIKEVYALIQNKDIGKMADLPHMTDPEMLRASKLLITMGPPCYRSHQRLWSVMVPIVVQLSLKFGNIPQVGYSHTAFAGLLIWVYRDYDTARKFSDLAIKLMGNHFRDPSQLSVFYLMVGSSSRHWFEPMAQGSKDYREAYEIGLRSGNLQYAAYAFGHDMYNRFFQGMNISTLIEDTERSLNFGKTRHNQWAIDLFEGGLKVFHALKEPSSFLTGKEKLDDAKYLKDLDQHHNIQVLCIYNILKTYSLLVCGRFEEGLQLSKQTDQIVYTVGTQGLLPWPEHLFIRYLLITGLYQKMDPEVRKEFLHEAETILVDLKKWAEVSPNNFKHKYYLALAEMAKIKGEMTTFDYYEKAIESARDAKFLQWEAVANERAAIYWRDNDNESFAFNYWKNAYVCFEQWGVNVKLNLMKEEYKSIVLNQVNLSGFGNLNKKTGESLKQKMLRKQFQRLESSVQEVQQANQQASAANYAEELGDAAKRLREEIKVRKETEAALIKSESMFHSLFTNMNEGVALHEFVTEGSELTNYRIIDVNPSYQKILTINREEIIGKLATEIYNLEEPPYLKEYTEVLKTQQPLYFETYFETLDKHFSISAVPWLDNGFATIFSDISFRVQNDERIKQHNMELQRINQEKDKFFSIISHDLKGPLGSLGALCDLFVKQIREQDVNWIENYASIIRDSVSHSVDLLANLIEWSQSQTGRMVFSPSTHILNKLLDEVKALLKLTASQKGIDIHITVEPDTKVYGDRAMISAILRNLVSNSIKFSNPGGEIHVVVNETHDSLKIAVRDNGVGISSADMNRLFKLDKSFSYRGTNNEKGTGLGLILSKEFVDKHEGKIWAESKKGEGSEFYVTIPWQKNSNSQIEESRIGKVTNPEN